MNTQTVETTTTDWWLSLKHGGLLIAPAKLQGFFVPESLAPLSPDLVSALRREITELQPSNLGKLLDIVLEKILQLPEHEWQKGNQLDPSWACRGITGETIKPRRVWQGGKGEVLPVFVPEEQSARLGIGRGKRAVSRVIEWLRKQNCPVGLLTNGQQWRLIHAGADYDAWCEWDTALWFQGGQLSSQVTALRLLLGEQSLRSPSPLLLAIQSSRQGQGELSAILGERVRQAVELLIQESAAGLAQLQGVSPSDIYIAACRVVMRCVVILFAEARDLLPRDNPIYHYSYGIQGLQEQLDRLAGSRAKERLRHHYSAWARLLALFRLVHSGSCHPQLPILGYGGGLFTPGDPNSPDPILRSLAVFENPRYAPSDAVTAKILELLCRSKIRVRQGTTNRLVEAPVDFSDLSSEYIGILYEGLLDFELRQAEPDNPMVFVNLGKQPALPLLRLEQMDDSSLASLVEKLKRKKDSTLENDEEDAQEDEELDESEELEEEELLSEDFLEEPPIENDQIAPLRDRIHQWAVRAVEVGNLVPKPRSKTAETLAQYREQVNLFAKRLIGRIVLPGEWFLVRWGGTRKSSGTFYTRPQLASPTVRRTLEPLVYERNRPKPPQAILALKVCDPACGSASFLVSALRYLTEVLWESLFAHGWLIEENQTIRIGIPQNAQPEWFVQVVKDFPLTVEKAEEICKARLKRYVVENCIYGVDINPLAVELGKLALWVETANRLLPFTFLDHKIKCGNALVGCWFDRFQDYPVMAWLREGGDSNHDKFVHHFREYVVTRGKNKGETKLAGDKWTQAIKDIRENKVKLELKNLLERLNPNQAKLPFPDFPLPELPETIHDRALAVFEQIHTQVLDPSQQEFAYREQIIRSQALAELKFAFDMWCAVWFWERDDLQFAPTPNLFYDPPSETRQIVEKLAHKYRFFHWELEFPDVFTTQRQGFDAIIGNPPWEIQKPDSREFFSNIDPLYRTYGRQEAIEKQAEYFRANPNIEKAWLAYKARLKDLSNWTKHAGFPWGYAEQKGHQGQKGEKFSLSRSTATSEYLHGLWQNRRAKSKGYADPNHPFILQGSAGINTYKMFLELSLALLKQGGRLGLIVPSGIYTDQGATALRTEFLQFNQWDWLFGFENRDGIFNIARQFKFCPVIVQKGGQTDCIKATFMQRSLTDWEEAENHVLEYPRERVEKFSPKSKAILEIRTRRDLAILDKIYANSVLLGDDSPDGWGIQYATEFHMTNDSELFPRRSHWEAQGYKPDEYGHWLKGNWQNLGENQHTWQEILNRPDGVILSRDKTQFIYIDDVEDIALPLYQGVMIWQFDFSYTAYVSGSSRQAKWENVGWQSKIIIPQFMMSLKTFFNISSKTEQGIRLTFRDISRATDQRTMIATIIPEFPCGHTNSLFYVDKNDFSELGLCCLLNSLSLDFLLRNRLGGTHLSYFIIEELCLPSIQLIGNHSIIHTSSLSVCSQIFARAWIMIKDKNNSLKNKNWYQLWALAPYERLRLRCILDAVVAELYGLDVDDFAWILKECDYPKEQVNDKTFCRTLDPKGFWRVDKDKDPELRHTVLSLVAFHHLKEIGLSAFLNLNDGEGWMLPDTLRLADYGLGHDDRAKEPQPVTSRFTLSEWDNHPAVPNAPINYRQRFYPWQLAKTPEQSWAECEKHAENLRRLLGNEQRGASTPAPSVKQLDLIPENQY